MATLSLVLRPPLKSGLCTISFMTVDKSKPKYKSTGYKVLPHQFRSGKVVKHPEADLINIAIEKQRSEKFSQILHEDIYGRPSIETFMKSAEKLLDKYKSQDMATAHRKLQINLNFLYSAWGKDLRLSEINADQVAKFIDHRFQRKNSKSTVKKSLRDLANVLNHIKYEGRNHFTDAAKSIKPDPVQREKLTTEEIKKLQDAPLTGLYDLARDMFLFSYYCQGMRFESVATFERSYIANGFLRYRMNKGKKIREVEIHPRLQAVILKYPGSDKYLFPVVTQEFDAWSKKTVVGGAAAVVNNYLKGASVQAGISKHVHFHMARHSFATIALEKDVSVEVIKDALGHSSYSTTQMYLKSLSDQKINNAVRGVYDD